jgi:hypothetical protein
MKLILSILASVLLLPSAEAVKAGTACDAATIRYCRKNSTYGCLQIDGLNACVNQYPGATCNADCQKKYGANVLTYKPFRYVIK